MTKKNPKLEAFKKKRDEYSKKLTKLQNQYESIETEIQIYRELIATLDELIKETK